MIGTIVALALAALACALAVLLPFSVWKDLQRLRAERAPSALAGKVDELEGRVDALKESQRRNYGVIWKTIGRAGLRAAPLDQEEIELTPTAVTPPADDSSFNAMLRLQSSPPVKPS
jgi:hypothetical protein